MAPDAVIDEILVDDANDNTKRTFNVREENYLGNFEKEPMFRF